MLQDLAAPSRPSGRLRHGPPASALIREADAINRTAGDAPLVYTSLVLAAWRGQEARALELMEAGIQDAPAGGETRAICSAEYARAVLYNGLARYQEALAAARRTCLEEDPDLFVWALAELVEAGARSGDLDVAAAALLRLEEQALQDPTECAAGIRARSQALLSGRDRAEGLYREALTRLGLSRSALHLARAHLLYGEWLRREGRRVDAREQLRAAHETFSRAGADGFAERARRELDATGERARRRTDETRDDLTPQEAQIARLAADGHTNPEIGAELFISPRTVEWHLRKIFRKVGVNSRRQLREPRAQPGG